MPYTSRLVMICLSVLFASVPAWAKSEVAKLLDDPKSGMVETHNLDMTSERQKDGTYLNIYTNNGPKAETLEDGTVVPAGQTITKTATTGDVSAVIKSSASSRPARLARGDARTPGAARRAAAPDVIPGVGVGKKKPSAADRRKMESNQKFLSCIVSDDKNLVKRMGAAYHSFGADFVTKDEEFIEACKNDIRKRGAGARYASLDDNSRNAAADFYDKYGDEDNMDDGDDDDRRPEAGACPGCSALTGQLDKLNNTIDKLNDRIAALEDENRSLRRAQPVPLASERNVTGNSIGFGIPLGPLLSALFGGGRNQRNPSGYFMSPNQRMFASRYGNGFGNGYRGGGPGFGPGGNYSPNVIRGGGGFAGNGIGRGGYAGNFGGGYGGQAGYPAVFGSGQQAWNYGSGTMYNGPASASSPLSIPNVSNSSLMNNSLGSPNVIPGGGGFA